MSALQIYYALTDLLCSPRILSLFGVHRERQDGFTGKGWLALDPTQAAPGKKVHWFHAASVGELEILVPLIEALRDEGCAVAVSIFSESALPALKRISRGLVYAGFSPRESDWRELLLKFQVGTLIASKYEAWPGLWAACSQLQIPLILINAQPRSSLRWVKRLLNLFRIPLPSLHFFTASETLKSELQNEFPNSSVEVLEDPRWKRIVDRSKGAREHPRVEFYRQKFASMPKPWGMVGSAWLEDLKVLVPALPSQGTLWVVPHSLTDSNLEEIKFYLDRAVPGRYVLVAELGILLELYSIANWVWVGGGFGKGIHSTQEPSVYGVPVACGPKKIEQFYETRELRAQGLLTVCSNTDDASSWLTSCLHPKSRENTVLFSQKGQGFKQLLERIRSR
jgi:3-deoxy-D-manno-octulosonic-acid transferase